MNFQEKMFEATQDLRTRAATFGKAAFAIARDRAAVATGHAASRLDKRVGALKTSLTMLGVAGRELEKVARRHSVKFVKQNASIAQAARKDVTSLALTTFDAIAKRGAATKKKARKPVARKPVARKPVARKSASRARVAKAA